MFWADKIADEIITSGVHKPYWVDDMKTPSGRVHIGSVRAVVTHELIYRALRAHGVDTTFSYVLEDHDPMDGLPIYVDQEEYKKHMGKPLYTIPSPEPGYKSYGDRWGQEYIDIFTKLGVKPKIIWGSELYKSGRMDEMVKLALDKVEIIRDIYKIIYKKDRPANWYPFQPLCEKCGKISTTFVTAWDGKEVEYECRVDGLDWTKGCGYKGKQSPFGGHGKMPWKVEWPCKWKVIGVTVEGAGKDHMTAGGSHDFAKLMCERVLNYPVPYGFSHEFFLVGGKKMSSSKGLGSSAKEVSEIIPPFLMRFLIARVKYNRQIDFNPVGMTIPDLFDDYDSCARIYWDNPDLDKAKIYLASQVEEGSVVEKYFVPRFREVANYMQQPSIDLVSKFEEIKGGKLTSVELHELEERKKYAQIWLTKYAPADQVVAMNIESAVSDISLSTQQKSYLKEIIKLLETTSSPEDLQLALYELSKSMKMTPIDAFSSIYLALSGKDRGPKAAWFLLQYPKEKVIARLKEITS